MLYAQMDTRWMLFLQAALLLLFTVTCEASRQFLTRGLENLPATVDVQSAKDVLVLVNEAKPSFICAKCLQISRQAEEVLSNPDTLSHARTFLTEQVCYKLKDDPKKKCEELLDTYVPLLLATLQEYMAPEKMCKESGFCNNGPRYLISNTDPSAMLLRLVLDASEKLKEEFADHLEDISEQIKKVVTHTCESPRNCANSPSIKADHCALCEYVVIELKIKLRNPKTQEKLIEILLEDCKRVPNRVDECQALVLQYVPLLLVNLETILDPKIVCAKIGACPAAREAFVL